MRGHRKVAVPPWSRVLAGLLPCFLVGLLSACGNPPQPVSDTVIIGLLVDNSRPIHQPVLNAARLAIEEIDHAGGLEVDGRRMSVELAVEDAISTPEQAATAAMRLINQVQVSAMVGCSLSRNAIPVGEIAERAHIPMISPASTNPRTTSGRSYVYRVPFTDTDQGQMMARFALRDLKMRRFAILFNESEPYSVAVKDAFQSEIESSGGEVISASAYSHRSDDLRPALERLAGQQPDALFLPNYTWDIAAIGKQMAQLGLDLQLLGSESWTTEILADEPGLDNAYVLQHWYLGPGADTVIPNRQAQRFAQLYEQRHGAPPFGLSALTFDAFGLLFQAIERAGSVAPEAINRQLAVTESFAGATGAITYRNQGGDPHKGAVIVRLQGGEIVFQSRLEP